MAPSGRRLRTRPARQAASAGSSKVFPARLGCFGTGDGPTRCDLTALPHRSRRVFKGTNLNRNLRSGGWNEHKPAGEDACFRAMSNSAGESSQLCCSAKTKNPPTTSQRPAPSKHSMDTVRPRSSLGQEGPPRPNFRQPRPRSFGGVTAIGIRCTRSIAPFVEGKVLSCQPPG